ncbi:hypothetical protein BD560DRAFT_135539 [Blakeslea trispora]|nr:hypothetical protein BD560DRAFT_135539 [Blakeslea trispora]
MMKIPDGSHIVSPGKAKQSHQRMTLDQQQADFPRRPKGLKSPSRRRSFPMRNTNSIARSEYAYNLTNSLPANMKAMMRIDDAALDMTSLPESTLLMEMQSFLLSNSFPMTKDADHNMNSALSVSSTSTSTSTSTSSTSSPNIPSCAAQNYVNESSTTRSDVDANSLNNLANHVLDIKEEPFYNMEDHMYPYANLDMARSATSSTNSSSSTYRSPYIQQSQWMCGSMIPHQSCPPIHLQTLGESVMVTITPLMSNDSPNIIQPSLDKPASTRILTCYFGSNCICPECMVHPSL